MPEFTTDDLELAAIIAAIGMAVFEDQENSITHEQTLRLAAWHSKFEERPGMDKIKANDLMEHLLNKLGA